MSTSEDSTPPDNSHSSPSPDILQVAADNDWKSALSRDDTWKEAVQSRKKGWDIVDGIPFF